MAKYVFDYETGEYEFIERDGFSIDRGEYTFNWDDSEYRREEKNNQSFGFGLLGDEKDNW